jgi:hypothetical protein
VTTQTIPIALGLVLARARWTPRGWAIESPTGQQVGSLSGIGRTETVRAITALRAHLEADDAEVGDVQVAEDLLTAYAPSGPVLGSMQVGADVLTAYGPPADDVDDDAERGTCRHDGRPIARRVGARNWWHIDSEGGLLCSGEGPSTKAAPTVDEQDSRPAGIASGAEEPAAITTPGRPGGGDQGPGVALVSAMDSTTAGGGHELSPQPHAAVDPHRAATITGLRQLADWLESHPAVPAPEFDTRILCSIGGDDDDAGLAEVQRVAAAVDGDPAVRAKGRSDSTHPGVKMVFGPIAYEVYYVVHDAMRRHYADSSYHGCVNPDPIEAPTIDGAVVEPAALAPGGLAAYGPTPPKLCAYAMTPTRRGLLRAIGAEDRTVYAEAGQAWSVAGNKLTDRVTTALAAGWVAEGPARSPGSRWYQLTDAGREALGGAA